MPEISRTEIFRQLPQECPAAAVAATAKVVVLDDDPTGTQTVHRIPVLMTWSMEDLVAALRQPEPCFYILTNTRAFPQEEACRINREIGQNLTAAGREAGRAFRVVSRSDSTLRGHFPAELRALADGLGLVFDATLIIPAFFAGGRYTIGDVHYVAQGESLVPVGETEFARDAEFGFRASNLREWVEEKTAGAYQAADVHSLTLERIRTGGAPAILTDLLAVPRGGMVVVNAVATSDLAVLTQALTQAEAQGRRFLFRTAAEFVPLYAGIAPRPLLAAHELSSATATYGGLVVAGSYVGRTSGQLERLFADRSNMARVELAAAALVSADQRAVEIQLALDRVEALLAQGQNVTLFTSRTLLKGTSPAEFGTIGKKISSALVEIVQRMHLRPRWFVAKGGITSSDIASLALGMRRALVLGQALPGVPVWAAGPESKWPGLAYIVFPGNVGGPDALSELVGRLHG